MQIGIANGIPLNAVITGDDLIPIYDQSTGTEGYVNLNNAVQKAFSGTGVANGILYLNGSKVATSGSALTFDGTTLSSVGSGDRARFGTGSRNIFIAGDSGGVSLFDGAGQTGNGWYISGASNFVAGYIGSSEQMRLTSTGLGIGTSSPSYRLDARGASGIGVQFLETSSGNSTRVQLGTASGVGYIDANAGVGAIALGFNVAGSERLRIDSSGNLGLGVTPSAWSGTNKAIDIGLIGGISADSATMRAANNVYSDSGGTFRYKTTAAAMLYGQNPSVGHFWAIAPSGTAGNAISFTQAMTLDAGGNLLVGTTGGSFKINVLVPSGENRDIAIFGVFGATNGVTIKWDQISSTIRMNFQNLPTSSAGLVAGDLWNDSGTLKLA